MSKKNPSVPVGYCQCGCGGKTTVYYGTTRRFITGHNMMPVPAEDRFWPKVDKRGPDECWEWLAGCDRDTGYGRFTAFGTNWAHRVSYVLCVGPIPEGLVIDHLCRNRKCVNPNHLEVVTDRVNILRGTSMSAKNHLKTHCKHGHEFTQENTYVRKNGGRDCRACHRITERERQRRLK